MDGKGLIERSLYQIPWKAAAEMYLVYRVNGLDIHLK